MREETMLCNDRQVNYVDQINYAPKDANNAVVHVDEAKVGSRDPDI